jgi:hypothetical protein
MSIFDLANMPQSPSMGGTGGIGALDNNSIYPLSRMDKTQYSIPTQLPTSAEIISSDYDPKVDAFTGMPQRFAKGGISTLRYKEGGDIDPNDYNAVLEDVYQKTLGRGVDESAQSWLGDLQGGMSAMDLANRLAQTEEGTAYGKANPEQIYKNMVELSQRNTPFKDVETPVDYSGLKYIATLEDTVPGSETGEKVKNYVFQDQNSGMLTVDAYGNPTSYNPGAGWYDEQLRKNPDALRSMDYRNQSYLSTGPLDKTYNFQGVDVPINAAEYQVDPKTGQFIKGATGEYTPLRMKDPNYDMIADWAGPVGAVAIPLAASYIAPYLAGSAATSSAVGATEAGSMAAGADVFGGLAGTEGAYGGLNAAQQAAAINTAGGAGSVGTAAGDIASKAAKVYDFSTPYSGPLNYAGEAAKTSGMTTGQKLVALNLATGAMGRSGGGGSESAPSYATTTQQSAPPPSVASTQFNPAFSMPSMFAMNQTGPGAYYQPTLHRYAEGGVADLGGYAAGGKLLKGPGDGMSDDIVANIAGKQPARLADGEFVVPADVVSHLGNGSTDAGAKHLYKMMDRIRQARTGNPKQGKRINPDKFLPKG